MTRCICFRRRYPNSNDRVDLFSFPIETEDHKLQFAQFMWDNHDKMKCFFKAQIDQAIHHEYDHYANVLTTTPMLSFRLMEDYFMDDELDESDNSMLFPFTQEGRLAFANWAIETEFENFVNDYSFVFFSNAYEVARAHSVVHGQVANNVSPEEASSSPTGTTSASRPRDLLLLVVSRRWRRAYRAVRLFSAASACPSVLRVRTPNHASDVPVAVPLGRTCDLLREGVPEDRVAGRDSKGRTGRSGP